MSLFSWFDKLFHFSLQSNRASSHNQKIKGNNNTQIITTNHYERPEEEQELSIQPSKLKPQDITNDIADRPLYQQKNAEKAYSGRRVAWRVVLIGVRTGFSDKKYFHLTMFPADIKTYPTITAQVSKTKYPELKNAKRDEVLMVKGTIKAVSGLNIELKNVSVHYEL